MKTFLGFITASLFSITLYSQGPPNIEGIDFINPEDYIENEPKILESANYILNSAVNVNGSEKASQGSFIMKWMIGTTYTFELGDDFVDLPKGKKALVRVYIACLAKAALDHKDIASDPDALNVKAKDLFLDYCIDKSNGVKMNKGIKKALKERV